MATSEARIAANRRNSALSTGPRTVEGKANSRLNAFQHGIAGRGDLLGPGEDGRLVAERAAAFARELGAVGATGQVLAHRAALLSVRMERLARDEMVAGRAAEGAARVDFDAERVELIAELIAEAEAPGADPGDALAALAACPDGLGGLLAAWRGWLAQLRSSEPGAAVEVVARWLGLGAADATGVAAEELARRGDAEVDRLRALAGSMGSVTRLLEQARVEAGLMARMNPAPELIRARRYEAAAERGMFRAIRTIAAINRAQGRAAVAPGLATVAPVAASPPPPTLPAGSVDPRDPLASFRAGVGGMVPISAAAPVRSTSVDPSGPASRPLVANRR